MKSVWPALLLIACDGGKSPPTSRGTTATSSATTTPTAALATEASTTSATASAAPTGDASAEVKPPAYGGPTGTIVGTIRIKGDPPPDTPHKYPKECTGEAAAMYGKLFRVGKDGALADALVAVTKYEGFVPMKNEAIKITVKGCAYPTRTIAMTDGQHLEVRNVETNTTGYLPWLDGAKLPAGIVAVPQGDPVKLYSRGRARYWLRDQMERPFMVAHVFHLPYSTTAVTGLDGQYRIDGIPVGKVDVSAMLPSANLLSDTKPFDVKAGENKLDFELKFDKKRDVPAKAESEYHDNKRK
jgi:hypothetical protein